MEKRNIPAAVAATNAYEALEDWARSRVQVWLQELLEDEVTQFLGREKSERSPDRRGYRNGHGKPRDVPFRHKIHHVWRKQHALIHVPFSKGFRHAQTFPHFTVGFGPV